MFLEWAIKNDLFIGEPQQQAIIAQVKNGAANGVNFLAHYSNSGHVFQQQFVQTAQQFVRQYCNNITSFNIFYSRDFALSFLTNAKQRDMWARLQLKSCKKWIIQK